CRLFSMLLRPPVSPLFPYTTLFRSPSSDSHSTYSFTLRSLFVTSHENGQVALCGQVRQFVPRTVPFFPYTRRSPMADTSTGSASDRKSTRLNSSHVKISYAVFCLKK